MYYASVKELRYNLAACGWTYWGILFPQNDNPELIHLMFSDDLNHRIKCIVYNPEECIAEVYDEW